MFSSHRKLFLALKKVQIVKIIPPLVTTTQRKIPSAKFLIPPPLTVIWKTQGLVVTKLDFTWICFWIYEPSVKNQRGKTDGLILLFLQFEVCRFLLGFTPSMTEQACSYKKKKHKKVNTYRKSLERKPAVNKCLLILHLKPFRS